MLPQATEVKHRGVLFRKWELEMEQRVGLGVADEGKAVDLLVNPTLNS